jgi:uncharacterized protein YggE
MRTKTGWAGIGIALLLVTGCGGSGTTGAPGARAAASTTADPVPPSITAQGTGRVTGVPDTLTVALSLHTDGDSAQQTLADNSTLSQQLLDAVKAQGIDERDVQTTSVSVNPRFDAHAPPRVVGYSADESFVVKLRDLSKASAQIDALAATGGDALSVQGIGYSIDDSTNLLGVARADAVQRAAAQAKQLADAAGVKLGPVRTITEVPENTSPMYDESFAAGGIGGRGTAASAVPLAPGSQQLTLTVTVVYDIA